MLETEQFANGTKLVSDRAVLCRMKFCASLRASTLNYIVITASVNEGKSGCRLNGRGKFWKSDQGTSLGNQM